MKQNKPTSDELIQKEVAGRISLASAGHGRALIWLCAALISAGYSAKTCPAVQANCVAEITLTTEKSYKEPFTEVTLDALFTGPDGQQSKLPAFWAGGNQWRFRYSASGLGTHTYRTVCSDATNPQLHGVTGKIEIVPYRGENSLYRHGQVRVSSDHRHFEQSDGTPFFWLGDTWWKGLCKRISWKGFQELAADRKAKGFTVVQMVAGPYPDEEPFDPRWANEGGMPYEKDYAQINPAYFDFADRRIGHLIDAGITPAIVGSWGWHLPSLRVGKMKRHWRYLIARYGAYPAIWIVGGEAAQAPWVKEWTEVARYVRDNDPYHHLATVHPSISARQAVADETVIDFDMLQTGHDRWKSAANTVSKITSAYSKTPPMPVLVGEVDYEGHMGANYQDIQRFLFWSCMLNGAAGHTYGAGGVWQMNSETVRGAEYEFTPWCEAMRLPGSSELGMGKRLLEEYPWWRFEPHPEWVEPHSTTLFEPHAEWYDDNKQWTERGGQSDLPYAAGIPGEVRFIYSPGHIYVWTPPTVTHLETNGNYRAFYFDPIWGKRYELGILVHPVVEKPFLQDDFENRDGSLWQDYGTPTERKDGQLAGKKGMVTVLEQIDETDLTASVDANTDAEAGIMLRFHDADNYLVGLYTPFDKVIYIHDRKDGKWGPRLGLVGAYGMGPRIRLTAAACGKDAVLFVTDGKRTCATSTVRVGNLKAGKAGLWLFQIGDHQQYDNLEISRLRLRLSKGESKVPLPVYHDLHGPHSALQLPEVSMVLGGAYTPPRLPSPQDWLLVLERVVP